MTTKKISRRPKSSKARPSPKRRAAMKNEDLGFRIKIKYSKFQDQSLFSLGFCLFVSKLLLPTIGMHLDF